MEIMKLFLKHFQYMDHNALKLIHIFLHEFPQILQLRVCTTMLLPHSKGLD